MSRLGYLNDSRDRLRAGLQDVKFRLIASNRLVDNI